MAKVEAVEIRPGQLLEWDKRVWRVLKSYHVHVGGRGGAFMQVEMKDIDKGTKTNQRFRTEDKIERAFVEPREMQYLYQDGESYVFMNQDNFEQVSLHKTLLGEDSQWLKENTVCKVEFYEGSAIAVEVPFTVELKVVETEPSLKGATITNVYKAAKLETGATVQVPPFIEIGEVIRVDTREAKYLERVNK